MADERLRTKRELKRLFTNLGRKGITDDMISILIDALWRDPTNQRTSGFYHAGGFDTTFTFNIATRIFSIIPFDPLVEDYQPRYSIFVWADQAIRQRIFTPYEIEIPNEEGLFCIYFDKEPDPGTNHILFYKKNPTQQELELIFLSKVLVSFFYWDAANNEILHFGDDRHGSEWNPQLHWYIHNTLGAQRKNGLQFTGYSLNGDGSLNDHARFNITGGVMLHDDFPLEIPGSSTSIPVLYSFGTLPRFLANTGYAFAGATRVYYNSGQISLAQADSGNYVLYHIFATNEVLTASRKTISVMGTAQYTTLADAYKGVDPELNGIVTYMPQQGRCYLGSIIIQTSDDYTNDKKARIVALTGNEIHPPVSIAPGSEDYLSVNEKQELAINVGALPGGEAPTYDWNIHGPQQIIGNLTESVNLIATIDGTGATDTTIAAGTYVIAAINAAGETLPVNVPEMIILVDTTSVIVDFDAVEGATGYRIYNTATLEYVELATNTWDYLLTVPTTPGIIPIENTAFIYQSPFTIASGNSVEVITEGIDIETEVDELDTSIKRIILKKQRTNWNDTEGPNVLDGKPTIPAPYNLPTASGVTLGGVKIGDDLIIDGNSILNINANLKKEWQQFEYRNIVAGTADTFVFDSMADVAFTINSIVLKVDDGTLTGIALKINGVAVTGLSSLTATTTATRTNATATNAVAIGNIITFEISTGYSGAPTKLTGKLSYSR